MNRRELLKYSIGSLTTLVLPGPSLAQRKEYKWFTHKQLMHIFHQIDGKGIRETLKIHNTVGWNGEIPKPNEEVYIAMIRLANIMMRRTLDIESKRWLVVSPGMCEKNPDIWYDYQFTDYSIRANPIKRHWRHFIEEEVSPGVYKVGNISGVWTFYVDEKFPNNKVFLGMGYKKVRRFRHGEMKKYEWGEHPELIYYMDRPTKNNYAVITLEYN